MNIYIYSSGPWGYVTAEEFFFYLKMDILRNSTRRSSNGIEVFSSSSRDEDDEEALKWAALEKLPTFDRLRKGILVGSRGASSEVDVHDLGFQERKKLIDRLVNVGEDDNEKFLLKLKNRIDR